MNNGYGVLAAWGWEVTLFGSKDSDVLAAWGLEVIDFFDTP